MFNAEKVTHVIVSDYSAKYYPFFGLYAQDNSLYRDRFDFTCYYCFYTGDEALLQEASIKLFSSERLQFLIDNAECIYPEHVAIEKFGKIYTDPMQYAVYDDKINSVVIFSQASQSNENSTFTAKTQQEFSFWMQRAKQMYENREENALKAQPISLTAFKYSRMYRNYSQQFDRYISEQMFA